jgi:NAD(P)-dependent dehydrogenase (short-subunit alcohol dehydrogenase family)
LEELEGRRSAELLADLGYNLAHDSRTPAETRSAAEKSGGEVVEFLGDVSDENDVARFANLVQQQWGRANVLVNNVGVSFISPAEQVSASDFRRVLAVNLLGPFLLCKGLRRDDAGATLRKHHKRSVGCGACGNRRPRSL